MGGVVDQRPRVSAVIRAKRTGKSAAGAVDIDRGITLSGAGFPRRIDGMLADPTDASWVKLAPKFVEW